MFTFKTLTPILAGAAIASVAFVGVAKADTLDNLERERAITIETMMDPALTPAERQSKVQVEQRRLVDLERMVIRDKSLRGKNTRVVRHAFKNYDLTFMAHAAAEKNITMVDNWLNQFGISTEAVMAADVGRR